MTVTVEELVIQLSAKTDDVNAKIDRVITNLDGFGKKAEEASKKASDGFSNFGNVIKGVVAGAAFQKFIQHSIQVEQSGIRLQAVLKATGRDAGDTANQISRLANELEGSTLFDAEDIKNASAQLLTFKNVSGEAFERTIRLGTDMAALFDGDVQGSIRMLGKALQDPADGVNMLTRLNVKLSDAQKQVIKDMADAGDVAGAQKIILDALQGSVGGVAEAMHGGLAGAIHDAKESLEQFMEAIADTGVITLFTKVVDTLTIALGGLTAAVTANRIWINYLMGDYEEAAKLGDDLQAAQKKLTAQTTDLIGTTDGATQALTKSTGIKLKDSEATKELTANQLKLNDASAKLAETLHDKVLDNALELQKVGLTPLQQKLAEVDDLVGRNAAAFKNMGKEGKDLVQTIKQQTVQLDALKNAEERAKKEAEEMQKAFDHAFENIQDALADMIVQGDFSFKSLVDIAKKAAAEIASAMIIRPIIGSIGGGLMDIVGLGGTASQLGGGSGGFGSILSGGKSVFDSVSSLISGDSVAGGFGSLNTFGFNNLGTGLPGLAGANTSLSLTGILGSAGIGAGLGGLTSMLTGGNSVGGSIGGGIGGLAGNFLFPGIGGIVGGALGGLVGGMFGGGKPHPASEFSTNFDSLGGLVGSNVASKHSGKEAGQAALNQVSTIAQAFGAMGIDLSGVSVRGGNAMVRGGDYYEVAGQKQISFNSGDAASADKALKELIVQLGSVAKITNDDVNEAFKNLQTEGKSATDVLNELATAAARPALKKALEDQLQLDILKITDPVAARVKEVNAQFDDLLTRATELGADITLVEKLRQLTLGQINGAAKAMEDAAKEAGRMAEKFAAVADQLADTLNDIFFSEDSIFSPQQQYAAAKAQFDNIAGAAQGGDLSAMQQLSDAFRTFISESREVNASGVNYSNDFTYGTSVLQNVMNMAASKAMAYGTQSGVAGAGQTDLSGISAAINALAKSQTQTNAIIKTMAENSGRRTA